MSRIDDFRTYVFDREGYSDDERAQALKNYSSEREGARLCRDVIRRMDEFETQLANESTANERVNAMMQAMQDGAFRRGTFLCSTKNLFGGISRAEVVIDDGSVGYFVVTDNVGKLIPGDTVLISTGGNVVVEKLEDEFITGELVDLVSVVDESRVVIEYKGDRRVCFASEILRNKIKNKEVRAGSKLLACPKRDVAFDAVVLDETIQHYRYLDTRPLPDINIKRDMGSPPAFVDDLLEHVNVELTDPESNRMFGLRRSAMRLLMGVSGTGKTMSIEGFYRSLYEMLAKIHKVKIDDIPPRLLRLKMSQTLSMWLGESDKNLDRFFDEVEELSAEKVKIGRKEFSLPVVAVCEEIDALARTRGSDQEGIHDRILTTALQRLDTTKHFKDRLVIFLFTTNVPHLVDPAFLRRAGGEVEHFGRLDKEGCDAVLTKHLSSRPVVGKTLVANVLEWLFENDGCSVDVNYASGKGEKKYRRDFLTGSVIDRSVQQASKIASSLYRQKKTKGITADMVREALDAQIGSIIEQLTAQNLAQYSNTLEGDRVVKIKKKVDVLKV